MKRFFLKLSTVLIVSLLFTVGCDKSNDPDNSGNSNNSATTDVGVVINGVKWATRNVDAFGTFAATPESFGMFYQWNRSKAWSATEPGEGIAIGENGGWDDTLPTGDTWEKSNDPSPKGWRVPTREEQKSLLDTDKVTNEWITQNGVTGRLFTDKATGNQLFLPAAGFRYGSDGMLSDVGTYDFYWSSTAHETSEDFEASAYGLGFDESYADWYLSSRRYGFSVRVVAE